MVWLGLCAGGDGAMDGCAEHWRVAYCVNMVLGTWEELGLSEDRHYRVSKRNQYRRLIVGNFYITEINLGVVAFNKSGGVCGEELRKRERGNVVVSLGEAWDF